MPRNNLVDVHHGPGGLRVEFLTDIYTPVMVYLKDGSATFYCAQGEGEVEGIGLTHAQLLFLDQIEAKANAHYDKYTHNNPENKR
jgi:hypothetical protein